MYICPCSKMSLTNAHEKSINIWKWVKLLFFWMHVQMEFLISIYIQLITSSSTATCLNRRWNFFWRLLLRTLRFLSVEAPSLDLLTIRFELEFRLEFDDTFTDEFVVCWRWLVAAPDSSNRLFVDVVIFGKFCITSEFDTTNRIGEQSNWFILLKQQEEKWKRKKKLISICFLFHSIYEIIINKMNNRSHPAIFCTRKISIWHIFTQRL